MKKANAILVLLLLGISLTANSQQIKMQKTFGNSLMRANAIQHTSDNGFVIVGYDNITFGSVDMVLVKTNTNGDTLWSKYCGSINNDLGSSVQQTTDGGYILGGAYSNGKPFIIRTNSVGDTLWTRIFSFGGLILSIKQTFDGGFVFISNLSGASDYFQVSKLDSFGNIVWVKSYDPSPNIYVSNIIQSVDSNLVITGYVYHNFSTTYKKRFFLSKISKTGTVLWARVYGDNDESYAYSVKQTNDGGFILAGKTSSVVLFGFNVFAIKTDALGNLQWSKSYGLPGISSGFDVEIAPSNGYLICGSSTDSLSSDYDSYLIRVDSLGNLLWSKKYGEAVFGDYGLDATFTSTGGIAMVGYKNYGASAGYLVMTDSLGNSGCYETTPNTNSIAPSTQTASITISPATLILPVSNDIRNVQNYNPFYSILCTTSDLIENDLNSLNFEIYPNPTSDYLNITVEKNNLDGTTCFLFDLLGNQVLKSTTYNNYLKLDVSRISSGIYIIHLNANGVIANRKIIISK